MLQYLSFFICPSIPNNLSPPLLPGTPPGGSMGQISLVYHSAVSEVCDKNPPPPPIHGENQGGIS